MLNSEKYLNLLAYEIQERKELLKGSYRDRHYNAGSILLGFGVLEAVGGGLNTWIRTGKLFPGPHLFGGAGKILNLHFMMKIERLKQSEQISYKYTLVHFNIQTCSFVIHVGMENDCWGICEQLLQCYGHFQHPWYHQCKEGVKQLEVFTLR